MNNRIKSAVLVIIGIVSFILLINYLKGENIFSSNNEYFGNFNNVAGLQNGTPVIMNGYNVGKVSDIRFDNKEFLVTFNVKSDFTVPSDAKISIASDGFFGGKFLQIKSQKFEGRIEPGTILQGFIEPEMTDQVEPLMNKFAKISDKLGSVLDNTNDLLSQERKTKIDEALVNLNSTLISYKSLSDDINKNWIKNQEMNKLRENANQTILTSNETLKKYNSLADSIMNLGFSERLNKIENTMAHLDEILLKVKNGDGSVGLLLNDKQLYANIVNSSKEMENLLKDLREHPKRYVHFSLFGRKDKKDKKKK